MNTAVGRSRTTDGGDQPRAGLARRALGRLATIPGLIVGGILTASIAWAVSTYLPRLVERVENPDPVRVTLFTNPAEIETFSDDSLAALVPAETPLSGTPGEGCRGFQPWVERLGGADVGTTRLRLVLRGNSSEEVLVERMRARVLERGEPAGGIPVRCPSAGAKNVRTVAIDLDSQDALGHYETLAGERPLAFSLAEGETEIFDFRVSTRRCHCVWVLDIGIVVGDEPQTLTIPEGGSFETTALPRRGAPMYAWDYASRWTVRAGDGQIETVDTASLRPLWR